MTTAKPAAGRGTALRLLGTMRPDWARISAMALLAIVSNATLVIIPSLLGDATDAIVDGIRGGGVDFAAVNRFLLWAAVLAVLSGTSTVAQGRLTATVVQRMAFRLRERTNVTLSRLPLSYFDTQSRGDLLSRTTNDIDNVSQSVQQTASLLLTSVFLFIGSLVMMLRISLLLTVVALVVLPVTVWAAKALARRAKPQFAQQWKATGALGGHLEDVYTGHDLVTAFGRWGQAREKFTAYNDDVRTAAAGAQFRAGLVAPALTFLGNVGFVLIAVVGGVRVAGGALTIGSLQAFIQYVLRFNQPISLIASLIGPIQSALASAERVFELHDADPQRPDPEHPQRPATITGRVVFTDVSFRYVPDRPLIDDLSLTVQPGQTVAIVGPTGAGKTTLVNLLLRFYDTDAGTIAVDGVDITDMTRDDLRRRIGMVLQDTWLYGGTIADNIAYGRPAATREEVVAAATAVHADHLIRTLPEGYDTVLDSEADGLSAGERQLITIARAFLVEPAILVLDEATSAVDTRTEMLVQQGLAALREGRTSFVIAHRLSTIRDADVILVMEAGSIVEQGSHAELIEAGGAYARLHAAQFTASPAASEA
ncbi:ABC transporter ATP-binding protein [Amycolatopsis vancoresmycina]|uniref:Fatty acid ABC transporter ATP-binding/permease protein n=1 Tax=Amycolatopsis vancoresmycina DSM 44592 TaxID=1292037 RepID=R1IDR6_9PSEU|nr:ABC transporter ATP-binding protein [Amycolatopsis vancoresmycina]EOD68519.1 ABC transporter-like protein [Amycolatopsis vancoresmycina DSM 44592]